MGLATSSGRKNTLGLSLSTLSFNESVATIIQLAGQRTKAYVCFANAHMTVEANQNTDFAQVVNQARLVCPDGVPLVWSMQSLHGQAQERVAGMDIFPVLLQQAAAKGVSVYFYGGTEEVLKAIKTRAMQDYPSLKVAGSYSPPFSNEAIVAEIAIVDRIHISGAQLVFVALGCPKQEKWMAAYSEHLPAVLLGVGGAFPVYAQQQARAPKWMRKIGMEWFFRFSLEPQRLWKRYFITNSRFVLLFAKAWLKKHLSS